MPACIFAYCVHLYFAFHTADIALINVSRRNVANVIILTISSNVANVIILPMSSNVEHVFISPIP